jgi:hypothetical protein
MGIGIFSNCMMQCGASAPRPAPNPSPDRWTLLDQYERPGAYALRVRYQDCNNFEGVKIMVYKGVCEIPSYLDPHFRPTDNAPVARFRPDREGWERAKRLVDELGVRI